MKIKNIERMLAREGDALLESKKERVLASCGVESRAKVTRPVSARPRIARMLAVAVCLLIVTSVAIPIAIQINENRNEYYYFDDIPHTEEFGSATYGPISSRPKGNIQIDIESEKVIEFLGSDTPFVSSADGTVIYYPNGELHSVDLLFRTDHGGISIDIVPNSDIFRRSFDGLVMAEINGYRVDMTTYYNRHKIISKPEDPVIKYDGLTFIIIYDDLVAMRMVSDNICVDEAEILFNYIVNADFDFEALRIEALK